MKSKEEIEQLAKEHSIKLDNDDDAIEFGFIEGYTQCQEDRVKDFLSLIEEFREKELPNRNTPYHYEAEIEAGLKHFEIFIKGKTIS